MERREFLAAFGTAATVASTSQVFAQTGGRSPQKVDVALYDLLKAKPARRPRSRNFSRAVCRWSRPNRRRLLGSAFVSDPQPSPFSTLFQMKPAGKHIWPGKLPLR